MKNKKSQKNIFLENEGDNWFERNKNISKKEDDEIVKIIDYLELKYNSLLEIGCSTGYRLNLLKSDNKDLYGIDPSQTVDDYLLKTFNYMLNVEDTKNFISDANGNREYNGRLLETKAFLTLISFIIEENQGSGGKLNGLGNLSLPSHNTLRNEIITELRAKKNYIKDVNESVAFKSSRALRSLVKAWDLYLALENAYEDLGGNLSLLLNASDKQFWNDEIYRGAKKLWQQTHDDIDLTIWGPIALASPGIQNHEVQAGN